MHPIIKHQGETELEIKKSQFICYMSRVESQEMAQSIIEQRRKQHFKARHHCYAYIIGQNQEIQRSSDDGEPAGTAGIPILEVLKRADITNTIAIVTRYFGGIKLGKGGLIRAYGQSVTQSIQSIGLVQPIEQQLLNLQLSYSDFDSLQYFLDSQQISIIETTYTEQVQITVGVNRCEVTNFIQQITQQFASRIHITKAGITIVEKEISSL